MTEDYLRGQVAIITGAGGGFGAAVATEFAERGANLVLNDLPSAQEKVESTITLAHKLGVEAVFAPGDATAAADVTGPADLAVKTWGTVDVLVNLVGGSVGDARRRLWDMADDEWRRTIELNLTTTFTSMKAVLPIMMEKRGGRIVNTASTAWAGSDGSPAYSAAKAAVVALTRTASLQVASYDVNVNAVAPGLSRTGALTRVGLSDADAIPDEWLARIPLGRINEAADVAAAISYLVSPMARNITGQLLTVAGGQNPSL